jgi:hypothetical protein
VHGLGRIYDTSGPSFHCGEPTADLTDPMRPIAPGSTIEECFTRCYLQLDADFWTTLDGIKGGLGFDARWGYWKEGNGGYFQSTTGNSGSKGTGLKVVTERTGKQQWEYQGHSMRMHFGECRPSGTPYEKYRAISMMISHNGPFTYGSPYGTEETIRCGNVVVEKGRQHCVELQMRMNSVVGPFDPAGNGIGVADGVMRLWVDGVMRWEKTDFIWRRHADIGIIGPWIVWVHGGTTPCAPGEVMHYRMANYAWARRYIGPRARV